MTIASNGLARHELIGLQVRVAASGDAGLVGLEGRVVDETMRTLVLATAAGEKMVPKAGQTFKFTLPGGAEATLEGRSILHRPQDRTRKARAGPKPRATHARGERNARA